MKDYKKIVLGVVLDDTSDELPLKQAKSIADEAGAELYIVHAIEHLSSYGAAYGVAAGADVEEMLMKSANEHMQKVCQSVGLDAQHCILEVGPARSVLIENADKLGADLVIVGSHGLHGIRLVLGSTANAVLHGAHCDVLAVRLQEN